MRPAVTPPETKRQPKALFAPIFATCVILATVLGGCVNEVSGSRLAELKAIADKEAERYTTKLYFPVEGCYKYTYSQSKNHFELHLLPEKIEQLSAHSYRRCGEGSVILVNKSSKTVTVLPMR